MFHKKKGVSAVRRSRKTYGTLNRSDPFVNLGPAGRNLFISRDKQMQHREARRLKIGMRIVLALLILAGGSAICMVILFGFAPWFRSEVTLDRGTSSAVSEVSSEIEEILEYDALGLPVYSEEICLKVISSSSPADEDDVPELTSVAGVSVDIHAADALRALMEAAEEDGLTLMLQEGYVSYTEQEKRFQEKVAQYQQEQGLSAVMANSAASAEEPKPGESDFQSGMTVRLAGSPDTFEDSRTYSWLKANMGKYGFVFRYPKYKEDYTGINADLTVIRYVGAASAEAMQQRSMCLEEYVAYLRKQ